MDHLTSFVTRPTSRPTAIRVAADLRLSRVSAGSGSALVSVPIDAAEQRKELSHGRLWVLGPEIPLRQCAGNRYPVVIGASAASGVVPIRVPLGTHADARDVVRHRQGATSETK